LFSSKKKRTFTVLSVLSETVLRLFLPKMLLELEDEALSMLFPSPSVEQTTASFIIKRDTYTRHAEKVPRELSLALLKKHHSLWGEFIYNAARVMSDRIDNGEINVSGLRVLELGAGAGLPGIIAALNGASHTVISDYADEDLIRVIELNIKEHCTDRQNVAACGFTFGENPQELLLLGGGESRFDVVLMADLLFNRSEHEKLLRTLHQVLVPVTGEAWCIFSHHDPLKAPQDLNFFERAERDFGFSVTRVGEEIRQSYPFVQKDGLDERRGVVNIYRLSLLPPAAT